MSSGAGRADDRMMAASKPRALVVEDDVAIRRLVCTVLTREGYEFDQAKDGAEAIAWLERGDEYAVIVLDLTLPNVGGEQVIEFLRGRIPESVRRIVVITAMMRLPELALSEELCVVLRKPFDLDEFVAAIRKCAA